MTLFILGLIASVVFSVCVWFFTENFSSRTDNRSVKTKQVSTVAVPLEQREQPEQRSEQFKYTSPPRGDSTIYPSSYAGRSAERHDKQVASRQNSVDNTVIVNSLSLDHHSQNVYHRPTEDVPYNTRSTHHTTHEVAHHAAPDPTPSCDTSTQSCPDTSSSSSYDSGSSSSSYDSGSSSFDSGSSGGGVSDF